MVLELSTWPCMCPLTITYPLYSYPSFVVTFILSFTFSNTGTCQKSCHMQKNHVIFYYIEVKENFQKQSSFKNSKSFLRSLVHKFIAIFMYLYGWYEAKRSLKQLWCTTQFCKVHLHPWKIASTMFSRIVIDHEDQSTIGQSVEIQGNAF